MDKITWWNISEVSVWIILGLHMLCILHSGWLCVTSRPALSQEDVFHWLLKHCAPNFVSHDMICIFKSNSFRSHISATAWAATASQAQLCMECINKASEYWFESKILETFPFILMPLPQYTKVEERGKNYASLWWTRSHDETFRKWVCGSYWGYICYASCTVGDFV